MTARPITPSQTVGPFFHDCMLRDDARCDAIVAPEGEPSVRVTGRVLDGDGAGVPDAVIEVSQPEGFARVGTDSHGGFSFSTVRPRAVPFEGRAMQAPHLSVAVFARGLLNHLFTRIYFEDDASITNDPILRHVPASRRETLVARHHRGDSLTGEYRFDIVLQGERETVFFDFKSPSR